MNLLTSAATRRKRHAARIAALAPIAPKAPALPKITEAPEGFRPLVAGDVPPFYAPEHLTLEATIRKTLGHPELKWVAVLPEDAQAQMDLTGKVQISLKPYIKA